MPFPLDDAKASPTMPQQPQHEAQQVQAAIPIDRAARACRRAAGRDQVGNVGDKEMRMNMFEITIARIEVILPNERGEDIRLTFQFESRQTSFTLPIFLKSCEFDDTEIVRVARSQLHDVFAQLCSQCEDWQLTEDERRELARISVRPGVKAQE
jgi:hypothetical protein